jgi:hypothetical protein
MFDRELEDTGLMRLEAEGKSGRALPSPRGEAADDEEMEEADSRLSIFADAARLGRSFKLL